MGSKILAVDDSKVMLRIVTGTIEMLDYEPVTAVNGKLALDVLEKEWEDVVLILLDWNMPEMNGYETLVAIKNDDRFKRIPVMMVTTESDKASVVRAVQAGAKNYLSKPFSQQDLATKIMESLGMSI